MNGATSCGDHSSPGPPVTGSLNGFASALAGPAEVAPATRADWRAVFPVLDEAAALPGLLAEVAAVPGLLERAVFVDNGSSDGSAGLLRAAGALTVEEPRRGYGFACLRGLAEARAAGAVAAVFMEADGSDDPADLPRLVGPVLSGDVDLMVGSRRAAVAAAGGMPWHQRLGNVAAGLLLRGLFGLRVPDNGPYRAVRVALLDQLSMEPRAFSWTTEMLIKAHQRGARIAWVEVGYRRRAGRSKIAGTIGGTVGAFVGIFGTMARLWWRARRPPERRPA